MAPKRKAAKVQSSGGSDDEEYRKKRDRNNQVSNQIRIYDIISNHFCFFFLFRSKYYKLSIGIFLSDCC